MQDERFDAVVIGSGQGGNPLAKATAKHGWKTAVIERRYPGGTCVNDGCTPSKTIDASAKVAYLARRGADFGVHAAGPIHMEMSEVYARKESLLLASRKNIEKSLSTSENSTLFMGSAAFSAEQPGNGDHALDVVMNDGSKRRLVSPRIFLNVGERPHIPTEIDGIDKIPYLNSTSIMELQTVPEHLVVIGAGYIALEFAQMFLRFGSKVTVLERGERLAQHEDDDIAACLRGILEEDGLHIITCSAVTRVFGGEGDITLEVVTDNGPVVLKGSHVLVATGRTPNVEDLQLARVGVKQGKGGYVEVNDRLETTVPGIWALGDVKGGPAFTHVSYDDYRILKTNLLDGGDASKKDRIVTYAMFTDPELATVGLTETAAAKTGRTVRVAQIPMKWMARANEQAEPRGMVKALVDPETRQILGATVLGVDGGEFAAMIQIAMMGKLPYTALRDGMFAHPTKSEALNTLFTTFRDGKE
jgi:pyruvate/2-oxoglutarate dehydrogenase complex dihydrolipoamide dehydrogenase (E3) component